MSNDKKKILLIFDFDKTIINDDSFGYYAIKMLTKEEKAKLFKAPRNQNWVIGFNLTLKMIKSHGTTLNEFNKVLEEIPLSKGMEELFTYIGKNKSKYEAVIMSSNYQYVIFHLLKHYNIFDIFSEIICTPSKESNSDEKDQFVYVLNNKPHNCPKCNPCNCKSLDFKEFLSSHDMSKYEKIVFVGDGWNDFCLAKDLSDKDVVFARKHFVLYKKLFEENLKNSLKCKAEAWDDAKDIVKYLQSI